LLGLYAQKFNVLKYFEREANAFVKNHAERIMNQFNDAIFHAHAYLKAEAVNKAVR
jgi:hypothetical protein